MIEFICDKCGKKNNSNEIIIRSKFEMRKYEEDTDSTEIIILDLCEKCRSSIISYIKEPYPKMIRG
jgi:hypothetical protein